MKFCQYCGKPLEDNAVCSCQAQRQQDLDDMRTVAANPITMEPADQQPQASAAPQRPAPQPPRPMGAPQPPRPMGAPQPQRPMGAPQPPRPMGAPQPPRPMGAPQPQRPMGQPYPGQPYRPQRPENKFVKAVKNFPVVFTNYWTKSDKLIGAAKKSKDWILPLMFIMVHFIVNLILSLCYFGRMTSDDYAGGLIMLKETFIAGPEFNFGLVLVAALIVTFANCFIYIIFRTLAASILAKKNPAIAFVDALIEFGIHSMVISLWLVFGSLLTLATCWLTVPVIGFAMAYYVVIGVSNTVEESGKTNNVFVRDAIMAAFIMIAIGLSSLMYYLACYMNGSH